jgi:predicted ATPase/DNA-binding CsgD family transcriptional regulator
MSAERTEGGIRTAAEQLRHQRGYNHLDEVSYVHPPPAGIDRPGLPLAAQFAGIRSQVPLYLDAMAGAAGATAREPAGTPDFADFISGLLISPAGYIGTTPTALIGRVNDLARLATVLASPEAGLVTVTGPSGVGKSRLVMEYFRQHLPGPGGAVEVLDFGQVADAAVLGRMLRQLNEQCERDSQAVRDVLERVGAGRHTLLLDHYEDVADELAPLLAEFRRYCPQVRIVSIGTTRLGLYGERVVRLQPLPTGDMADAELPAVARIPAVELFVQCARSVLPEFTLTAENSRPVLALCQLLGGLPFAIELAASQAKLAEPELILERLKREYGDLRRIGHHPYSRHSSISDLVSWVFGHLHVGERLLLNQLAIFEGPFTMRAAAEVVDGHDGSVYRTVERLIDKSVLIPDQRDGGELSLSMPSVVRLAAARSLSRLPGCPALRQAHAEYFRGVAVADLNAGARPGPDIRADLMAAFGYWRDAGDGPAMAVIATALRERSGGAAQAWQCLRLAEAVLRVGAGDPRLHARTLEAAGEMAMRAGAAASRAYLAQARDAYRAVHDDDGVVRCLRLLGDKAYGAGDLALARRWFEEGLAALAAVAAGARATAGQDKGAQDTESEVAAARPLLIRRLAVVLREAGILTKAGELAQAALAAELGRNDARGAVLARYVLATIGWLQHDSAEARALFADAAGQVGQLPDASEQPECLELLAITLWKWRRVTNWHQLTAALGLADQLRRRLGVWRPKPLNEMITPILAAASQGLTADEYARAWQAGAELPWAAALRLMPEGGALAASAGTDVPADVTNILTKRELEVALLVAEGLTNRVIAHKLGIAEWTVVNHLRKVMRKFGCQSRVQVTRRLSLRRQ